MDKPTYPIYNWGYNPLTKWDEPPSIDCFEPQMTKWDEAVGIGLGFTVPSGKLRVCYWKWPIEIVDAPMENDWTWWVSIVFLVYVYFWGYNFRSCFNPMRKLACPNWSDEDAVKMGLSQSGANDSGPRFFCLLVFLNPMNTIVCYIYIYISYIHHKA